MTRAKPSKGEAVKHIEYSCDWCGARSQSKEVLVIDESWPDGWTIIDDHALSEVTDELMCCECVAALRRATALVRAERLTIRGVKAEEVKP